MTKDEALKLALEALEEAWYHVGTFQPTEKAIDLYDEARTAIKEALAQPEHGWTPERIAGMARLKDAQNKRLAQPEQEPVAWVSSEELLVMRGNALGGAKDWRINVGLVKQDGDVGLYTTPPQRTWVGLTDEDKNEILVDAIKHEWDDRLIVEQIEAKLKEKNT